MKIILMRHGRPLLHLEAIKNQRKSPAETGEVIRNYEFSELAPQQKIPIASMDIAHACAVSFSSSMHRAIGSVQMLGLANDVVIHACFAESAHPYLNWRWPKLRFFTWCILFRVAWLMGFAKNGEAISIARDRAQQSAGKLQQAAQKEQTVLLLGHGIMNHLIVAQLKKLGWQKTLSTDRDYWSYTVLEKFK